MLTLENVPVKELDFTPDLIDKFKLLIQERKEAKTYTASDVSKMLSNSVSFSKATEVLKTIKSNSAAYSEDITFDYLVGTVLLKELPDAYLIFNLSELNHSTNGYDSCIVKINSKDDTLLEMYVGRELSELYSFMCMDFTSVLFVNGLDFYNSLLVESCIVALPVSDVTERTHSIFSNMLDTKFSDIAALIHCFFHYPELREMFRIPA